MRLGIRLQRDFMRLIRSVKLLLMRKIGGEGEEGYE